MTSICAMRDFLIFILCFSSLHTTIFAVSARGESANLLPRDTTVHCPYFDSWSLLFLTLILASSGLSLTAFMKGWNTCNRWTWVVDATGIVPGILWQISTRPAAYGVGGLTLAWDQCSYEHVPAAQLFRMLGEWLTYGTLLRLTQSAGFGTRLIPSIVIVSVAIVSSGVMYIMSSYFREIMSNRLVYVHEE